MQATDILQTEHRVIEQVLDCLEKIVEESRKFGRIDRESARQAIEFFKTFADGCHHAKEEKHLFPMLEARGMPRDNGPTGVMMHEHEEGRKLIRGMTETLPGAAAARLDDVRGFAEFARAYIDLLRQHIAKEDHCLFPMADRLLSAADDTVLINEYNSTELHDVPAGAHERFLAVARELANRYQVAEVKVGPCGCGHAH